jgi:AcrR family transcriptional regulator
MITVSTSKIAARAYHHGDLRSALVEAGLAALNTTAIADLSLRQLARDVGVSATAVYRHFPDKQALLAALASEGMEQLGHFQQAAAQNAASQAESFAATGQAYVRFALANPALFRLIFSQRVPVGQTIFGDNLAARMLQDMAASTVGGNPDETRRLMIQAWSVVHGLAMLMLDQQLPPDDTLIAKVIDSATLFPR